MVAPLTGVALAVSVTAEPTLALEPLEGAVKDTAVGVTAVTTIPVDVTVVPVESITLAVSVKFPADDGVQVTVYGELETVPIIVVPPTRNCTCATVTPLSVAGTAVIVTDEPTFTTEPTVGAVIEIVVAACAIPTASNANAAVNQRRKNAAAADGAPHSGRPTSDEVVVMG
jgi:hypothetical protein